MRIKFKLKRYKNKFKHLLYFLANSNQETTCIDKRMVVNKVENQFI